MELFTLYLVIIEIDMLQKLTPELKKKIEDSGVPLVHMTMEQFKSSLGKTTINKTKNK